jgi:hypothetical protein
VKYCGVAIKIPVKSAPEFRASETFWIAAKVATARETGIRFRLI